MLNKYGKLFAKYTCLLSMLFAGPISAAAMPDTENHLDKLPAELLEEITKYLDPNECTDLQSLGSLGQVSKYWQERTNKILNPVIKIADSLIKTRQSDYSAYVLSRAINEQPDAVIQRLIFLRARELLFGNMGLHRAIQWGDPIGVCKILIKKKPYLIHVREDESGRTPLHAAVSYENCALVRLLINSDANIHAEDKLWRTAKDYLSWKNNSKLEEIFREAEEKINLADKTTCRCSLL